MNSLLTQKQLLQYISSYSSKYYNDINEYDDTWKDVDSEDENEFQRFNTKKKSRSFLNTEELKYQSNLIRNSVSFDNIVKVILVPEVKEYDNIKHLLWYEEEEIHEFVSREIEIRKKVIETQNKELTAMRNEEIYTIMSSS